MLCSRAMGIYRKLLLVSWLRPRYVSGSLKKSRRSSHRRATIAMTAWPTRHTAADWHPTAKGQFRQMTKFREFFPYVFSIGYRHVRYVYSQLARTTPNEKSLPTSLFEHPQKGTPPLQWRAPNRAPLGSERREALTHHTAQSLNPLVGRNKHHTSPRFLASSMITTRNGRSSAKSVFSSICTSTPMTPTDAIPHIHDDESYR